MEAAISTLGNLLSMKVKCFCLLPLYFRFCLLRSYISLMTGGSELGFGGLSLTLGDGLRSLGLKEDGSSNVAKGGQKEKGSVE